MAHKNLEVIENIHFDGEKCHFQKSTLSLFWVYWLLFANLVAAVCAICAAVDTKCHCSPDKCCSKLSAECCQSHETCSPQVVKHEVEIKVTGNPKVEGTIIVAGDVDVRGKVEGAIPVIVIHDAQDSVGTAPNPNAGKKPEPRKDAPPRTAGCK